jgi:hypothetical protein
VSSPPPLFPGQILSFVPYGNVNRKQFCFTGRTKTEAVLWEAERKSVSVRYALKKKEMKVSLKC